MQPNFSQYGSKRKILSYPVTGLLEKFKAIYALTDSIATISTDISR